jgi:hypothetical protein
MIRVIIKEQVENNNLDYGIIIDKGNDIKFILVDLSQFPKTDSYSAKEFLESSKPFLIGSLELQKGSSANMGPCLDAYNVNGSSIQQKYEGKGIGKMMYKLAMAYVYNTDGGASMMPDRRSVSDSAKRVWSSLEREPESEVQTGFQVKYKGKNYKLTKLDGYEETPPIIDDCEINKIDSENFINKAYRSPKLIKQVEYLISKADDKLNQRDAKGKPIITNKEDFIKQLVKAANTLFARRL